MLIYVVCEYQHPRSVFTPAKSVVCSTHSMWYAHCGYRIRIPSPLRGALSIASFLSQNERLCKERGIPCEALEDQLANLVTHKHRVSPDFSHNFQFHPSNSHSSTRRIQCRLDLQSTTRYVNSHTRMVVIYTTQGDEHVTTATRCVLTRFSVTRSSQIYRVQLKIQMTSTCISI